MSEEYIEYVWPMGIIPAIDNYFFCLLNPAVDYYYAGVIEEVNALVLQAMQIQRRICSRCDGTSKNAGWIGFPVQSPGI